MTQPTGCGPLERVDRGGVIEDHAQQVPDSPAASVKTRRTRTVVIGRS